MTVIPKMFPAHTHTRIGKGPKAYHMWTYSHAHMDRVVALLGACNPLVTRPEEDVHVLKTLGKETQEMRSIRHVSKSNGRTQGQVSRK